MMWMADEEEQAAIRRAGWNAGLGQDPEKPEAGVFFNSTASSKMTWYLDLEPELSAPVKNEDGSVSCDLTVVLRNTMTAEERQQASGYITGYTGGITGSIYLFAPAGGSITELTADNGRTVLTENYRGLDLGYLIDLTVMEATPVTLHGRITTAPGVDVTPKLVVTPTMTAYR